MDAGGRATQDAKAEGARRAGEGVFAAPHALSPAPSHKWERGAKACSPDEIREDRHTGPGLHPGYVTE
jgi:hypothetical protein